MNKDEFYMSPKLIKKRDLLVDKYFEGMKRLGKPISKRQARRIINREMGFTEKGEVELQERTFKSAQKAFNPKYK